MVAQKKKKKKTKQNKKIEQIKLSLEVVEVVLAQYNLVNNKYQQKPEVLNNFTPNKFNASLLNVEPSTLVFLKTYNIDFDEITTTFTDQNGRLLVIED